MCVCGKQVNVGGVFCLLLAASAVSVRGFIQCVQMKKSFSFIFSHMLLRIHEDTDFQVSVDQWKVRACRAEWPMALAFSLQAVIFITMRHSGFYTYCKAQSLCFINVRITCRIPRLYTGIWYVTAVSCFFYFEPFLGNIYGFVQSHCTETTISGNRSRHISRQLKDRRARITAHGEWFSLTPTKGVSGAYCYTQRHMTSPSLTLYSIY